MISRLAPVYYVRYIYTHIYIHILNKYNIFKEWFLNKDNKTNDKIKKYKKAAHRKLTIDMTNIYYMYIVRGIFLILYVCIFYILIYSMKKKHLYIYILYKVMLYFTILKHILYWYIV